MGEHWFLTESCDAASAIAHLLNSAITRFKRVHGMCSGENQDVVVVISH